jgi:hypothetical protein
MPPMSLRQGIKCFGEAGFQAEKKELQQLHDRLVMKVWHNVNCPLSIAGRPKHTYRNGNASDQSRGGDVPTGVHNEVI